MVSPIARGDAVACLVNVIVRPGYNLASADEALRFGHKICREVSRGQTYSELMGDVMADFTTSDEYQATYIIGQSVNELCPESIWQLQNSAAGYRPTT